MKLTAECIPCLLKRALYEIRLEKGESYTPDEFEIIKEAAAYLGEHGSSNKCSAVVATGMHHMVYQRLGTDDPYKSMKDLSNEMALKVMPKARAAVDAVGEPGSAEAIKAAVVASIIGNLLDFGIRGGMSDPALLEQAFEDNYHKGLAVDHTEKMIEDLDRLKVAVLLTDNCGEVVLDTLIVEQLVARGIEVHVMVKKEAILTDAMDEDLEVAGMKDKVASVCDNNGYFVGLDLEALEPEVQGLMARSVIISKGMANFEALSEPWSVDIGPLYYLMRTKCQPVSDASNSPLDTSVVVSASSLAQ